MSKVFIRIDDEALEHARKSLSKVPGGLERVLVRAVNRALTAGRAQVSKSVRENYTVRSQAVKKTVTMHRASKSDPVGEIKSQGSMLPLREFKHSPKDEATTGGNRRKVRVTIRKGTSFMLARGFKWHGHVFARRDTNTKSRVSFDSRGRRRRGEPIDRLAGPSVPAMIEAAAVEKVRARMREVLEQRIEHEAKNILEKPRK